MEKLKTNPTQPIRNIKQLEQAFNKPEEQNPTTSLSDPIIPSCMQAGRIKTCYIN